MEAFYVATDNPFLACAMAVVACTLATPYPTPQPTQPPIETIWPTVTARPDVLDLVTLSATPSPGKCQVIATALNVRSGPDVSYPAVAWLRAGQEVTLLGDPAGAWVKVETAWLKTGWVNSAYLECGGER